MLAPDRDVISQKLGVRPYRICPSDIWPCRRPRYFWTSWTLQASSNLRLEDHGSYLQVRMLGEKLPVQAVLEKHESTAANFTKFPTFLRSVPKKRPPFNRQGLTPTMRGSFNSGRTKASGSAHISSEKTTRCWTGGQAAGTHHPRLPASFSWASKRMLLFWVAAESART